MKLRLHIERLVLDGLPLGTVEGRQVQAAMQAELQSLLADSGISDAWRIGGAVPRIGAADVNITPSQRPADVGHVIARAVHGAMASDGSSDTVFPRPDVRPACATPRKAGSSEVSK